MNKTNKENSSIKQTTDNTSNNITSVNKKESYRLKDLGWIIPGIILLLFIAFAFFLGIKDFFQTIIAVAKNIGVGGLFIIFSLVGFILYKYHIICLKEQKRKHIQWITNCKFLQETLIAQQQKLQIDNDYIINSSDIDNISKILTCFKKDLVSSYISSSLSSNYLDKKVRLNDFEYFFLQLYYFLCQEQLKNLNCFFLEYKIEMYTTELIYENDNHSTQKYAYHLTDFSLTYQKLYLIVSLFCESNPNIVKINPHIKTMNVSEIQKEIINTQKIVVTELN